VKRYAAARREGRPLAPKKHPGTKPELYERAKKILEDDVEERGPPSPSRTGAASSEAWWGSR